MHFNVKTTFIILVTRYSIFIEIHFSKDKGKLKNTKIFFLYIKLHYFDLISF